MVRLRIGNCTAWTVTESGRGIVRVQTGGGLFLTRGLGPWYNVGFFRVLGTMEEELLQADPILGPSKKRGRFTDLARPFKRSTG